MIAGGGWHGGPGWICNAGLDWFRLIDFFDIVTSFVWKQITHFRGKHAKRLAEPLVYLSNNTDDPLNYQVKMCVSVFRQKRFYPRNLAKMRKYVGVVLIITPCSALILSSYHSCNACMFVSNCHTLSMLFTRASRLRAKHPMTVVMMHRLS